MPNRKPSENGNQNFVKLKGRYVIVKMEFEQAKREFEEQIVGS